MKRKRKIHDGVDGAESPLKRVTTEFDILSAPTPYPTHPVLCRFYPRVQSLRAYLFHALPLNSRRRRRAVQKKLGERVDGQQQDTLHQRVQRLLDSVLVGCREGAHPKQNEEASPSNTEALSQALTSFNSNLTIERGLNAGWLELVDFCVWLIFNRKYPSTWKPPHVLCHGLQRARPTYERKDGVTAGGGCGISGLTSVFPNEHLENIKSTAWAEIMHFLGFKANGIMIELIVECGLFLPAAEMDGSYYQLSGTPLCDLPALVVSERAQTKPTTISALASAEKPQPNSAMTCNTAANIRFVRNRMFYAKAAMNGRGEVFLGLRHIHVLNRYPDANDASQTAHVMRYIFPRQFQLHNVFTSTIDKNDTTQPFKDYTLREQEIAKSSLAGAVRRQRDATSADLRHISLPKRLRGQAFLLTRRLQKLHCRCSYIKLMNYYCHTLQLDHSTNSGGFAQHATPHHAVSAFCRAVLANVLPHGFLGDAEMGKSNREVLARNVDSFIKARRFESFTLEQMMHGIKVNHIPWLTLSESKKNYCVSLNEGRKRRELIMELIYYVFDSIIVPLVRSNFHVTESSTHRNRLFYFRHDVWKRLAEPSMIKLKLTIFAEMQLKAATKLLEDRTLGFSQLRLLPKAEGMRPIANLKRRMQVIKNGKLSLAQSINRILSPVFYVLNYERSHQPQRLGASLFSAGDAYARIQAFRSSLRAQGRGNPELFFVKVDVQSCFDTIPQKQLLGLIEGLLSAEEYSIAGRAEVKPPMIHSSGVALSKPRKMIIHKAYTVGEFESFLDTIVDNNSARKKHTVFVDNVAQTVIDKKQILNILREHIENNLVKIGKKFCRQVTGIAQGSILSTILCNFFYADFEMKRLAFLHRPDCLLLRLIDDFLLITTDQQLARRFFKTMFHGDTEYGVTIKPDKSLINFDLSVAGIAVPRLESTTAFPYCGIFIDTRQLEISRKTSVKRAELSDTLTVEYSRSPGQAFRRTVLSKIKRDMHTMLFNAAYNSIHVVLTNIYRVLIDAADIYLHYIKSIFHLKEPAVKLLANTVEDIGNLTFTLIRSKRNVQRCSDYKCTVSARLVKWMTSHALLHTFETKQTRFEGLLGVLRGNLAKYAPRSNERALIERVLATL